jgi:hypothetical protein
MQARSGENVSECDLLIVECIPGLLETSTRQRWSAWYRFVTSTAAPRRPRRRGPSPTVRKRWQIAEISYGPKRSRRRLLSSTTARPDLRRGRLA